MPSALPFLGLAAEVDQSQATGLQIALLKHALKHPFASYTVVGQQNSHGTSDQTAKNDLTNLVQKGLFLRGKSGKAFVYIPAPDLAGKLGL